MYHQKSIIQLSIMRNRHINSRHKDLFKNITPPVGIKPCIKRDECSYRLQAVAMIIGLEYGWRREERSRERL